MFHQSTNRKARFKHLRILNKLRRAVWAQTCRSISSGMHHSPLSRGDITYNGANGAFNRIDTKKLTTMFVKSISLSSLLLAATAQALDNGFGRTPIMGFSTYNDVGCSPNQSYVQSTINSLADKGFATAGYRIFQLDCGWQGYQRQSNGSLTFDAAVFPDGIAPLSRLAISKGFQWGMYTDQGIFSCDTQTPLRPGSLGFERQDALQFAGWNAAYVKVWDLGPCFRFCH